MSPNLPWNSISITGVPALLFLGLGLTLHLTSGGPSPSQAATLPPALPAELAVSSDLVLPAANTTDGLFTFATQKDRGAVLQGGDGLVRVELEVASQHAPTGITQATDLVVVLDTSGSMSGDKILDAKAATQQLVDLLGVEDRFSLVVFSGSARCVVPMAAATPAARSRWAQQIDHLEAGGSTQMLRGLAMGKEQFIPVPGRATRTILISDGLPDSQDGLLDQALLLARLESPLTTVGIGSDYDEQLLSSMADAGTGNFYWVERRSDLAAVFADEFSTTRETVASALQVDAHLAPGVELVDAAGYTVQHDADGAHFRVGSLYAGQTRKFWVTLRVHDPRPGELDLGTFDLLVGTPDGERAALASAVGSVSVVQQQSRFLAALDSDNWSRGLIAEEYNALRRQIASQVQAGNKDGALAAIHGYRAHNRALNETVNSDEVWDNLAEVDALEADLNQQFAGEQQAARQNLWAKDVNASAYSSRRAGQAKGY